jgi:hypothetical protein
MPKKAQGHKVGNSTRVYLRDAEDAAAQTVRLARAEGFEAGEQSVIALLERETYSGADPLTTIHLLAQRGLPRLRIGYKNVEQEHEG